MVRVPQLALLLGLCANLPASAQTSADSPDLAARAQMASLRWWAIPSAVGLGMVAGSEPSSSTSNAGVVIFWMGALVGPARGYGMGQVGGRGLLGVGIRTGMFLAANIAFYGGGGTDADLWLGAILAHGLYDVLRVRPYLERRWQAPQVAVGMAPGWVTGGGLGLSFRLP